jgi:hypothetical protein
MAETTTVTSGSLRTPKAAGIVFSVLLIVVLGLFRLSVPADPLDSGAWLRRSAGTVALALNLMPFAGIAFLWFIGVMRDRLGRQEDRFFATVFFGSGLLFLSMLFASAAVIGAVVIVFTAEPDAMMNSTTLHLARALAYNLANVYAIKMAGVFMISLSTVIFRTGIASRWIAILGFILAIILLVGSYYISWCFLVLPLWVLLISVHILIDNYRSPTPQSKSEPGALLRD